MSILPSAESMAGFACMAVLLVLASACTTFSRNVVFTPDGRLIAADRGDVVQVWDTSKRSPARTIRTGPVTLIAPAPKGNRIAVAVKAGFRSNNVQIWDTATGNKLLDLEGHGEITSITFSPDGSQLVLAEISAFEGPVYVYDAATGQRVAELEGGGITLATAFSRDGSHLATAWGIVGQKIRLFNARTWEFERFAAISHSTPVYRLAFSLRNGFLATVSQDEHVRLWDLDTGEIQKRLSWESPNRGLFNQPVSDSDCSALAFSPDGSVLATGHNSGKLRLWNPDTEKATMVPLEEGAAVTALAFSPDGNELAVSQADGSLTIWDTGSLTKSGDLNDPHPLP